MTFSIAARCADTGMLGVAVSSSSPAVAARCAFVRANVGAVLSQNITDPRLGEQLLNLMAMNLPADEAISIVARNTKDIEFRQLLAVDTLGISATHTGSMALGIVGESHATNVACGGNLLANSNIPQVILDAFTSTQGHLANRLLASMYAAVEAGGEAGPIHSAGLKLVGNVPWPVVDLRVDWTEKCPITELKEIWELYEPQLDDYISRALNPTAAPSYGVPGDQ